MGMDMMYMDMGLMAETTYYYRVAAMNSVGMGEYSDGMAMATTMVTVVDAPPLGPASGLTATANADGSVMLTWTTGTSATHHFVAGTDGAFDGDWHQSMGVLLGHGYAHRVGGPTDVRYGVRLLRHLWPIRGTSRWQLAGQVGSRRLVQRRHGHRELAERYSEEFARLADAARTKSNLSGGIRHTARTISKGITAND